MALILFAFKGTLTGNEVAGADNNSPLPFFIPLLGRAPTGSCPFPSPMAVTAKRDYSTPSVENQESIAQMLSKSDIQV